MQIVRATDRLVMPWKNGGGSTTEIAVAPPAASLDGFDWRVSMATVGTDGPFSSFVGVDRTLAIVEGNGVILSIGSNLPVNLGASAQISFPGDVPTSAWLISGETTDLNVMTRRDRFRHSLQRVAQPTALDFHGAGDVAVVLSLNGSTAIASDTGRDMLEDGDAAVLRQTDQLAYRILPAIGCDCFLVWLRQI
ncbi:MULTISPECIES: HutD family protein [Rhodopseudomonas]|uniref:HutD family protein n=1 Tax=Rhodopseudomonas palustris TaxID=1076 RepID=A0A0D7F4F1_RHOPL|nr:MULTISPECIES: HutD family protein [Rhodopseudomonas]KIZ47661.1 hypothetical protein OO17_03180 [Rhodopseudomonas palustris]MDF3808864.1 HutD family protein [Rhodopseudomonas sp. BAL398]WOK19837.1 HutD family protein [Rhodopseudomonas sp. BAL398]